MAKPPKQKTTGAAVRCTDPTGLPFPKFKRTLLDQLAENMHHAWCVEVAAAGGEPLAWDALDEGDQLMWEQIARMAYVTLALSAGAAAIKIPEAPAQSSGGE
jgi:hypothetical protein